MYLYRFRVSLLTVLFTNIDRIIHVPGTVLDTGNTAVMRYRFPVFMELSF